MRNSVLLVFFVVLFLLIVSLVTIEQFATTTVYSTNALNFLGSVSLPPDQINVIYQSLQKTGRLPINAPTDAVIVLDPLDAKVRLQSLPVSKAFTPKQGYFVVLSSITNGFEISVGRPTNCIADCSYNLPGKRIGYFDQCEYNLIQAIMKGYRVSGDQVIIQQIPMNRWDTLRDVLNEDVDIAIAYVVPGSPFHILLKTQEVSVLGWGDIDINRVFAFHPFVATKHVKLKSLFMDQDRGTHAYVLAKEANGPVLTMTMAVRSLAPPPTSANRFESFVSRLSWPTEANDPTYRCFGDETNNNMALCESPYDPIGLLKDTETIWDKPCLANNECPFWDPKAKRGGCQRGGTCEMPTAILRKGYKQYDNQGIYAPFCPGCDPYDSTCCTKGNNATRYIFPRESLA